MNYTDEHLSAYLDGQLDEKQANALKERLETDVHLAERLAAMLEADQAVRATYQQEINRPVAPHILALLEEEDKQALRSDERGNVTHLSPRHRRVLHPQWALPIAAVLAMAFGLFLGRASVSGKLEQNVLYAQMTGTITAANPLYDTLESAPSAVPVKIGGKQSILAQPILTFKTDDGRYCREFITETGKTALRGIACRNSGVWELQYLEKSSPTRQNGYRTASGSSGSVLDDILDEMIIDAPLGKSDEVRLLGKWRDDDKS